MGTGDLLSAIVPSWREGPRLLEAVRAIGTALGRCEVVVTSFDERDEIRDACRSEGVVWVDAPEANRGLQLRLGAERSQGRILAFVHADSRLPLDAGTSIRTALATDGVAGGAFRLRFDRAHPVLDFLSWASRMTHPSAFLGDQGIFCSREAYEAAGGFCPEPLFEDVDLARRLARIGRLVRLPQAVTTSARRFTSNGPLSQLTINVLLLAARNLSTSLRQSLREFTEQRSCFWPLLT